MDLDLLLEKLNTTQKGLLYQNGKLVKTTKTVCVSVSQGQASVLLPITGIEVGPECVWIRTEKDF